MARKNPLPEKEKAVCKRLREFRQSTKLSQVAFAKEIGLDASRLASYEHQRVPVPYDVFRRASIFYSLNPLWLADGVGEMKGPALFEAMPFSAKGPFSERFEEIREKVERWKFAHDSATSLAALAKTVAETVDIAGDSFEVLLVDALMRDFKKVPKPMVPGLVEAISKAVAPFIVEEPMRGHSSVRADKLTKGVSGVPVARYCANELTTMVGNVKPSPMPTWSELKLDLQGFTAQRGGKASLARYCGVTPQAVAKWLATTSKTEPGAAATLKLLDWIKERKRKNKNGGSGATTPLPPTTPIGHHNDEAIPSRRAKPSQRKRSKTSS